ncbi:MAG: hypothetical protein DRQ10_08160 [Candidatus Hydrothermota bacterium]|nr:MAG: hypothetical protein DRQ10_08160 [Candidatus Hydrothermae bacterium]
MKRIKKWKYCGSCCGNCKYSHKLYPNSQLWLVWCEKVGPVPMMFGCEMFEARDDQGFGETMNGFEKSSDEEKVSGENCESSSCHNCFKETSDNEKVGENVDGQIPNLNGRATNSLCLLQNEQSKRLLSGPI